MALMRTSNPALAGDALNPSAYAGTGETMTISGAVNKAGVLLILCVAGAAWTWNRYFGAPTVQDGVAAVAPFLGGGVFVGLILAVITVFRKQWSAVTAPLYALVEGVVLGGISAMYESRFHGIAQQAVALTFGVLLVMLLLYRFHIIRVTERLRMGIVAATGGIFVFYMAQFVMGFFGVHFTAVNGASPIGIGFSVLVVIIAAFNLVLDFDFIDNAANAGLPKYMEWYSAFALMVTLIWLYLEVLRLLGKGRER